MQPDPNLLGLLRQGYVLQDFTRDGLVPADSVVVVPANHQELAVGGGYWGLGIVHRVVRELLAEPREDERNDGSLPPRFGPLLGRIRHQTRARGRGLGQR